MYFKDDFEDIHIRIPHNDELTSSSDDSEFEFFNYREHRKTLTSLAQAVRLEFLQSMPVQCKRRKPTSLMQSLSDYMSLSKTWQNNPDSETQSDSSPSPAARNSAEVKFCHPVGEKKDVLQAFSLSNPFYETITEEPGRKKEYENNPKPVETTCVTRNLTKVTLEQKTRFEQSSKSIEATTSSRHELLVTMSANEPPKNALVLYWGRISMTAKELRNKNLSRCIKDLLEEDHYEFVLLKIQERKFLLQYCNASKNEGMEEKVPKNKRKKSLSEAIRSSGRELLRRRDDSVQLLQNRRGSRSNLLSCIGLAGSNSRSQHPLHHNDSLSLKSYQLMKRKKISEFDYQKVLYCGVEERSIPNNMLVWIYHTEYGNYSAVECHCLECDDQSHARQLARGLKNEIAKANNF